MLDPFVSTTWLLNVESPADVSTICSQGQPVREVECQRLFQQLAVAVDYCHRLGIANRDIKLDNLLLAPGSDGGPPVLKMCDVRATDPLLPLSLAASLDQEPLSAVSAPRALLRTSCRLNLREFSPPMTTVAWGTVLTALLCPAVWAEQGRGAAVHLAVQLRHARVRRTRDPALRPRRMLLRQGPHLKHLLPTP